MLQGPRDAMSKMKRFLIIGATGFIGRSFGQHLLSAGHQVLGLARTPLPGISFPVDDCAIRVTNIASAIERFRPDVLVHAAGTASAPRSMIEPNRDFRDSVEIFQQVLEGVRRTAVRPRIVYPSSAAVYGEPSQLPISETTPLNPISPYGFHKRMCEELAREYAQCFEVPALITRLFSLFGMHQRRLLVWEVYEQFRAADEVVLQGSGYESRDYLHIDDMAGALLRLLDAPLGMHQTVNVASGEEITVRQLVDTIGRLLGSSKPVRFRNARPAADPNRWRADISLFTRITGRAIASDLESRLKRAMDDWGKSPQAWSRTITSTTSAR